MYFYDLEEKREIWRTEMNLDRAL